LRVLPSFYYHPRMLEYDLGPQHPLKPERLRRTIAILERLGQSAIIDPGLASPEDAARVHSAEYVAAVERIDAQLSGGEAAARVDLAEWYGHGFGSGDNPPFAGMYGASLAYLGGSVRAAEAVRDGALLSFSLSGGLHHALRDKACGFCIFDDPAVAAHILLDRFERVAYVDIDVHHGDGVQWIFYDEPRVLTCSIHEEGRTLFPGTGWVDETGADYTSLNVPLQAKTTGDVWLEAFREAILPALHAFEPQAIVLQMGTDAHYLDRLGHLQCTAQEWLAAIADVRDLGVPIVAVGGGGYTLTTVPRMWVAACLTLGNVPLAERLPEDLGLEWGMPYFLDQDEPSPRRSGEAHAREVVDWLKSNHLPNIPRP
jgi:acetoin utilization protein AcuC